VEYNERNRWGGDARSQEVGRDRPGEKRWLRLGCPASWASKRREILVRASVSTWAGCPGKRPGSRRDLGSQWGSKCRLYDPSTIKLGIVIPKVSKTGACIFF
jgi:hypothetical protein